MATQCEKIKESYDPGDVYYILADRGFFSYSGSDGDLFRANGLGGWRISVYTGYIRIQKKGDYWGGAQRWNTKHKIGCRENFRENIELTETETEELRQALDHLINNNNMDNFNFKEKLTLENWS